MNIVVTGGAGFIGSNLCDVLSRDHVVTVIDDLSTGNIDNLPKNILFIKKDINHILPKDFDNIEVVFHCAALARVQASIKNPLRYNEANIDGTLKLLEAARHAGVKKFIYSGSSSAYGDVGIYPTPETAPTNPMSPYALQKLVGEMYCKQYSLCYNLPTVCLRYFNVYGERMPSSGAYNTVIGIFNNLKKLSKPLTITNDGEQRRDFTYVKDVVSANILAMENDEVGDGDVFNIGSGINYSVNEIAGAFDGDKEFVGEVLEPRTTLADNTKAAQVLGWKTTQDVIEWIKHAYVF